MARVLIDDRTIESAVAVREAAEADGHTTEIISSIDGLDRSLAGGGTVAFVSTGVPADPKTVNMLRIVSSRVPRPPVIMVAEVEEGEDPRDVVRTGQVVQVPLFIKTGDRIRISTEDGTYLERA